MVYGRRVNSRLGVGGCIVHPHHRATAHTPDLQKALTENNTHPAPVTYTDRRGGLVCLGSIVIRSCAAVLDREGTAGTPPPPTPRPTHTRARVQARRHGERKTTHIAGPPSRGNSHAPRPQTLTSESRRPIKPTSGKRTRETPPGGYRLGNPHTPAPTRPSETRFSRGVSRPIGHSTIAP